MTPVTPTQAELDASAELASHLNEKLVELIKESDAEPDETLFTLWTSLIHWLLISGWTTEELVEEVIVHGAIEESNGSA